MNRRAVFAVACLGMLVFGIVLTMLGTVLPGITGRFGIDKAAAGTLFLLMSFGIMAGSLVFGPIADRYGYKGMLAGAIALVCVGLQIIAFAPTLGVLRLGIALIGFGGGIINGGTNAVVAETGGEHRTADLSILGIFFGIGAVGVPFALGMLLARLSMTSLVAGVGAIVVLPLVATLMVRFPEARQPQGFPIAAGAQLARDPVLLRYGMMLFLASGMEITVGGWTSTYFSEELGLAPDRAIRVLSLYWLGMMLARLALGSVLRRTTPARALLGCLLLGLAGAGLMLGANTVMPAALGTFLLGAGFAASFPVVLGFVGERYTAFAGTAFSIVLVMALTGGMILPWLTGVLGAAQGLRTSFLVVPLGLVALGSLVLFVTRRQAAPAVSG